MGRCFVYFLRPVGADGPVKIGSSWDPPSRLRSYMTWSPVRLEIAATVDGDAALERRIQNCFADQHSHSEWFHPSSRLTDAIEALARGVPLADAIDLDDVRGNALGQMQMQTRIANGTVGKFRPRKVSA